VSLHRKTLRLLSLADPKTSLNPEGRRPAKRVTRPTVRKENKLFRENKETKLSRGSRFRTTKISRNFRLKDNP